MVVFEFGLENLVFAVNADPVQSTFTRYTSIQASWQTHAHEKQPVQLSGLAM